MFNFNLNWDAIADFSTNFDPVAFEKELAAIVNVMTVTAVNSPAVVDTPKNTAPSSAAVQTVVNQVAQAVAPIVAPSVSPRIITKLEDISVGAVLDNPQIKSSPSGSTVSPTVVDKITSSIASTFKNDAQKDLELRKAIQESIDDIPPSRKPKPIPTVTQPGTTVTTMAEPDTINLPFDTTKPATTVNLTTTTATATASANVQAPQKFTGRGISNDPLMADGKAFTGNRNGIDYKKVYF